MSTIHDTWIWITCWMEIYIYLGVNVSNTQKAIFTKNLACCLWKRSTVHGAYISSFSWTKIFINFWTNQPSDQKRIIFSKDHTDTLGKIFIIQNAWISNRILNKNLISMLKIPKKLISLKKETYCPDISAIHGTWNSNPWTKTCIDLSANVPNYLKNYFKRRSNVFCEKCRLFVTRESRVLSATKIRAARGRLEFPAFDTMVTLTRITVPAVRVYLLGSSSV